MEKEHDWNETSFSVPLFYLFFISIHLSHPCIIL